MGRGKHGIVEEKSKAFSDLLKQAKKRKDQVNVITNTVRAKIKKAKGLGINTKRAEGILKNAEAQLNSAKGIPDFDAAIKTARDAEKAITFMREQYDNTEQLISSARSDLATVSKKGLNVSRSEKILAKAEKAFAGHGYETATKLANSSTKETNRIALLFAELEKMIKQANSQIAVAKKTKANMSEVDELLGQVHSLRVQGEYGKALTLSKLTVKKAKAIHQNYLKATALRDDAFKIINEASDLDADTSAAEQILNDASAAMEEEDYERAIEAGKRCIEVAGEAKDEQVDKLHSEATKLIEDLKAEIGNARKIGADTRKPVELLNLIKASLANFDFKTTFEKIDICLNSVNESKSQHEHAQERLQGALEIINGAESLGANIEASNQVLSQAKEAFKKFDYETVESRVNKAVESAENARDAHRKMMGEKEQTEDLINTARTILREITECGILVEADENQVAAAEDAFQKADYQSAQELATNLINECKEVQQVYDAASEKIQQARHLVADSKAQVDCENAEKILMQAQAKVDSGNYPEALEWGQKTIDHIENLKANNKPTISLKSPEIPTFKTGTWGKLQINISNESKVHANDIQLKTAEEIESGGILKIQDLKAGASKSLEIGLRTNEVGDVPVTIGITFVNPVTNEQLRSEEVLWVKTEAGAPAERPVPPPEDASGDVKVLSEAEFYQGFVRLKVGIKNEKDTVITDAKLDIEYDDTAMRVDKVEPELNRRGNKILFGNIHPKEKRTVAFYLDPLICTESFIDGTLTYKDIYGKLGTSAMKRRKAEVVCPIMFTPENINTAMLKRMIAEELSVHDSKIYEIPPGMEIKRAAEVCKETILEHDTRFVREFIEGDIDDIEIESWFYGTTKVKKYEMVIKSSVRSKTNTIELYVACDTKEVLTGFLAELGHNLNDKLQELGLVKRSMYPVTDARMRDEIITTGTLLYNHYLDKTFLSLSKRGTEYEVGVKITEEMGDAFEVFEFIKVSPETRQNLIDQVNHFVTISNIMYCAPDLKKDAGLETRSETTTEDEEKKKAFMNKIGIEDHLSKLVSFGELIFGMFLPVQVQKHLVGLKEPLVLKTNDNEIPWEMLHDGNNFLCLNIPVGRRMRTREVPRKNPVTPNDKIRFLFIANPTGELQSAENEVNYIRSQLGQDIEVDTLTRESADNASILSALRSGKYDIIHYAGHAVFDADSPDESALIASGNSRIFAQTIKRTLGGRPFVFLNACSSGVEKLCENGESYSGSDTEGLASSFIFGGSLALIGASWPTPDTSAGILASEFYKHFLTGDPVGESLRLARLHLRSVRPTDINWMAFILYGDPTIRLAK